MKKADRFPLRTPCRAPANDNVEHPGAGYVTAEGAFIIWLLALDPDADLPAAAKREIAQLDRTDPLTDGTRALRGYLLAVAGMSPTIMPTRNRREVH
ncbi:MAG: hypothetical protein AAGA21_24995 [Pseudomonadota bacterium]